MHEITRHMRRARNPLPIPNPMKMGTTAVLLGIIGVTAVGFYFYNKNQQPVTQFQPGGKYTVTGSAVAVGATATLPWQGGLPSVTYNSDGTASFTATWGENQPLNVPPQVVAKNA
jgi:hypothetical protein